jgi:hypothetical protein
MRLFEITSNTKKSILTEAARFGSREVSEVMKHIKDFRFGLEFEFNVDDSIGAIDYMDSLVSDPIRSKFLEKLDSHLMIMARAYNSLSISLSIDDLVGMVGVLTDALRGSISKPEAISFISDDVRTLSIYIDNVIKIISSSMSIKKLDPDTMKINGIGLFTKFDPKTINLIKRLKTIIPNVTSSMNDIMFESFVSDLSDFVTLWKSHIYSVTKYKITDSSGDIATTMDAEISSWYDDNRPSFSNGVSKVEWVKANHPIDKKYVQKVVPDATVPKGVELVTNPLTFDEALDCIDQVFSYISKIGNTDQSTGLHINISNRSKSFKDINVVKSMTLLDEHHKMFGNSPRWAARLAGAEPNFAGLLQKNRVGETAIEQLAKILAVQGVEKFVDVFEKAILRHGASEKYMAFNIKSLNKDISLSERRVEYRLVGGTNYHRRKNEVVNEMLHVSYVLLAGMSEGFLRREYIQSIFRMLDKICKMGHLSPFMTIVDSYRQRRNLP